MSWLELQGDKVCLALERHEGKLMLVVRRAEDGDCQFACSAANLRSALVSGVRYHLAGEDAELSIQEIGGQVMLSLRKGMSTSVYRVSVGAFENALSLVLEQPRRSVVTERSYPFVS